MAEFVQIYTERQRKNKIRKEISRLTEIIGENNDLATELISSAAFLKVGIEESEAIMKRDGIIERYQNGDKQWGQKKSAAVEVHDKFMKNYMAVIREIADIRSGGDSNVQDDFMKMLQANAEKRNM